MTRRRTEPCAIQLDLFGADNLERTPDPREREAVVNTALAISGTDVIDDPKATGKPGTPGAPSVPAPGPGYGLAARPAVVAALAVPAATFPHRVGEPESGTNSLAANDRPTMSAVARRTVERRTDVVPVPHAGELVRLDAVRGAAEKGVRRASALSLATAPLSTRLPGVHRQHVEIVAPPAAPGVGDARVGTGDHPLRILKPVVDQALVEAARSLEQLSAASQIPVRYCKAAVKAHLLAHLHNLPISEALDGRIASDEIFRWFLDGETGVTASMVEVCATHFSSTVDKPFFDPVLRFACARELQWLPCFRYSHWLLMRCLRLPLG